MPVSTIANRRSVIFDKNLELRDIAAPAISADLNGTPLLLDVPAFADFVCAVNALQYSGFVRGSAYWEISVEASADGLTWDKVGSTTPNGKPGQFLIALDGNAIEAIAPRASRLRVVAKKVGGVGPLAFGAFLANT
jgi:hypothetical protein